MKMVVLGLGAMLLPGLLLAQDAPEAQEARVELQRLLQNRELEPVREPDRVETFALESTLKTPAAAFPKARAVVTDLPGSFVMLPDSTPVARDLASTVSRLLLDPASYAPWQKLCIFSPGVAIRFHRGGRAVDAFICFECLELAFQTIGESRSLGKLSFDPVQEELFALVKRARPADRRLESVRKEWEEEAERGRQDREAAERWRAAMPVSLRPFWKAMSGLEGQDVASMQAALAREIPETRTRILTLLQWYGSGAGPWSGHPSYESVAGDLLLTYSTRDLLSAIKDQPLNPRQMEGTARLFAGWTFRRARPQDGMLLTPGLRERLLRHSLASGDKDKRDRARAAFETR